MCRSVPVYFLFIAVAVQPLRAAEDVFRDDFSTARGRYELIGAGGWKIAGGQCRVSSAQEGTAVVNSDELDLGRSEVTLSIASRVAANWVTAGLTLYGDSESHWRLLLVAGPDDKRYFELVERYRGTHQAQTSGLALGTKLAMRHEGDLKEWTFGRPYRLALTVSQQSIVGEIRDPESGQFWRRTFSLAHGKAVRSGRPGLTAGGVEASFREFVVRADRAAPAATLQVPAGPSGRAAILRDESGRMAAGLESLLRREGFGVTVISWEEFARTRIAATSVDLLVLADARRLPGVLVRPIESFLRARGKLVAVGAPAFGQLLLKGPQGYVDAEHYGDALYAAVERRPIRLDPTTWRREAPDAKRPASIEPDPAAKPGPGWKITMNYAGWDNFGQKIPGAFDAVRALLCFTARGDGRTPQLAIECRERDGSRWIATVALSTELRRYVVRPGDFSYWHDSKSKRGGPGDCFNPADAVVMLVGLSRSHTPQSKPGLHAFWIGDLSTAADPAGEQADARTPEIQALSPSYMLYPVDDASSLAAAHPAIASDAAPVPFAAKILCPVGREAGQGFDRARALRWIRLVDAYDAAGRNRGALIWLAVGQNQFPGAMWLGLGLVDPGQLLAESRQAAGLRKSFGAAARAMARGALLLEGGARFFSYSREERVELGGRVLNAGRSAQQLSVRLTASDGSGKRILDRRVDLRVPADEQKSFAVAWDPPSQAAFPLNLSVELLGGDGVVFDRITHGVALLPSGPAAASEFVTVDGSRFMLQGKPWTMRGMNYRPNTQGGRPTIAMFRREAYDPEAIERDLAWMQSVGINMLSAIQAAQPETPEEPGAFRDLVDFLDRCQRHGMKVFYFLPWGNPLAGGDVEQVKQHITAAGIKHHPAILAWELSWEPIYYAGPAGGKMDFLVPDWNAWIAERYGSLAEAERDWGYRLERLARPERAALPRREWLAEHGPWDRAVAAFRRFFDDYAGSAYGRMVRELRRFDPSHLVTFRFGACGIPDKARFAHSHSAAVAKHVSFLCPEGYNLQTGGWATPTPADDLRKGGLVTLYYRFLSREKPVVWMEFGYTVNGFHRQWRTGDERISPAELAAQRTEYENFYRMFVESGARGAAPWWLPGGFRLGEESDFGLLEPDGSARPACQVLREYLPRFAATADASCVAPGPVTASSPGMIHLDFDAHFADAWDYYAPQYLSAVQAGQMPKLGTEGTGTTSANCPLTAVGNRPCTGRNPPKFLNAEMENVEIQPSPRAAWREARSGEVITVARGAEVRCRVVVGNTGEAAWLAPNVGARPAADGTVWLHAVTERGGPSTELPIGKTTRYLADAEVEAFRLPLANANRQTITLQLVTRRTAADGKPLEVPFGQQATIALEVLE